ncbi:MAG: hypothetical protein QF879_17900 [Candidatus Latescibacteria bacterium]|nr:hypothetical protein [Candidatus Latescibacterota bacterium]
MAPTRRQYADITRSRYMMQKFGFDFGNPYDTFDGLQVAFRVCTLENVYGDQPGYGDLVYDEWPAHD